MDTKRVVATKNPHHMTDRQWAFCRRYVKQGFTNGTGAYRHVFPNCKSDLAAESASSRMLRNVKVSAYLSEVQARASEEVQVDANYVLEGLKEEAERLGEGSSHSARVRALELIGKHLGMFTDKRAEEHGGEPEEAQTPERAARLWAMLQQIKSVAALEKMMVDHAKKQMSPAVSG